MNNANQERNVSSVDNQRPYLGLNSFQETDTDYFYGRQQETKDLVKLIDANVLTVVFGKSGVGKTSLLRAGLIPRLRDRYYLPVYVRIDFGNKEKPPLEQLKEITAAKINQIDPQVPPIGDLTLWEYFSTVKILNGYVKPLLFFDQFEELFTTGRKNLEQANRFVTQVADLVENRVPVSVRQKMEEEGKVISFNQGELKFRVIFSLREDYLALLENLDKHIPSIRDSRYRVSQMTGKAAIEAVIKPGKDIIEDPKIAEEIIEKIPGSGSDDYRPYEPGSETWEDKKIEPFLLSLFCYQVNEKRLEQNSATITHELIQDVNAQSIIKDYYQSNIIHFEPHVKTACEDLLLTSEGYRKIQDLNSFKTGYGVSNEDIESLIERRIIRMESRSGIKYIELIHDVLAPILKESRDKRQQEELRKQEVAQRKKKFTRLLFTVITLAAIGLTFLTMYAFKQKTLAEQREVEVMKAKAAVEKESRNIKAFELSARSTIMLPKDPTLSLRLAQHAYDTEKNNPDALNALLDAFYHGGFYQALMRHEDRVLSAGFTTDGKIVVTVGRDSNTYCWDLTGKKLIYTVKQEDIVGSNRSPSGFQVRIDSDTGKIALLLNPQGQVIRKYIGHTATINSAVFSPDGKYIVTAADDYTARLWDVTFSIKPMTILSGHTSDRSDFNAYFSPAGKRVLTVNSKRAVLWDLKGNQVRSAAPPDGLRFREIAAFSSDSKIIAIPTQKENTIAIWSVQNDKNPIELLKLNGGVNSVTFSPGTETNRLLTANRDNTARLWSMQGKQIQQYIGHTEEVNAAVFSPDGTQVLTASWDRTARLWTIDGKQIQIFKGHKDGIYSARFSGDGQYILTAGRDGTARLWDIHGTQLRVFEGHTGEVTSAFFAPNGKHIVTASEDKTVRLWDLNGIQVYEKRGFRTVLNSASFSPDKAYMLAAPARGPARFLLIDPQKIIDIINTAKVWQLDRTAMKDYNL